VLPWAASADMRKRQAAYDGGLITTKYKERTIKRPPAGESHDRPRPWKRGVFKEQT